MTAGTDRAPASGWRIADAVEAVARLLAPRGKRHRVPWLLITPAVLTVGVLVVGLGALIDTSLHELNIATYRLNAEYSVGNYLTLWEKPVYLRVLTRTLLASAIVTVVTVALAFPYAYVLVRTSSALARKALLVALFLPFFIGQVVRAYGWLIVLGKEGLVNQGLVALGLPPQNLLFNLPSVIFGLVQYMLPFAVLLVIPAITAIAEDLELAAESLGASWTAAFRTVVLPLARPGLIGAAVVVFTLTMTDFAIPEILGGGSNDFIASAVYDSFFQISNPGLGAALSLVLVAIGSVLVAIMFALAGTGTLGVRAER